MPNYFLPPSWLCQDDGEAVYLIDAFDGREVELTGRLRSAFLEGRLTKEAAASTLARLNPAVERLMVSARAADPEPLTRRQVLRGAGWRRLFIELTGQCNENCAHCYAGSSPDVRDSLDEATVMQVLAEAADLGFSAVQLTGGDPLISPLCVPAAQEARRLGFETVQVYTNGLALKGEVFDALHELDVAFSFSIYGQDPLVHDTVTRVTGSHRRTLEAIGRAVGGGHAVHVGVVDTGTAGFDPVRTKELIMGLGVPVDRVGFDVERSMGRGSFRDETMRVGAERGPVREVFAGNIAVSYRGEILPCPFSRDLVLGHIGVDSLAGVLNALEPVTLDASSLVSMARTWTGSLTCWKCQVRAALLTGRQCERSAA